MSSQMAALQVFRQVGKVADGPFMALEVIPCLWAFSLGPLLNLDQFQEFMALIKALSTRVEQEQVRKLEQLGGRAGSSWQNSTAADSGGEQDFESLVTGRAPAVVAATSTNGNADSWENSWDVPVPVSRAPTLQPKPAAATRQPASALSATVPAWPTTLPSRSNPTSRTMAPTPRPAPQNGALSQASQSRTQSARQAPAAASTKPNYSTWNAAPISDSGDPWSGPPAARPLGMQLGGPSSAANPWAAMDSTWGQPNISLDTSRAGAGGFGQTAAREDSMDKYDSLL